MQLGCTPIISHTTPTRCQLVESLDSLECATARSSLTSFNSDSILMEPLTGLHMSVLQTSQTTIIQRILTHACDFRFFDRFIPIFPVMHRPTFVYRDCSHQLLLNAIALGSLYLGPSDSIAKGEVLWRLAHTAVATSWQTLIAHRSEYDACPGVQLILSSVLSVTYGALSKNTAIRASSQALHSSAFFWARQCGIFDSQPYILADLPSLSASHSEKYVQPLTS